MKLECLRDRYLEELKDLYSMDEQVVGLVQKTFDPEGAADHRSTELAETITKVEAGSDHRLCGVS